MTDVGGSRRGKYAKLEDVQFAFAMIRDLELHRRNPSSRPKFMIHGRVYPYHEITRRVQRAKKSGTWIQESFGNIPQPGHIKIIPARISPTQSDESSTDDGQDSRDTTSSVRVIDWESQMDYLSHYCYHQLAIHDDVRMFTTPSDPEALQKTAKLCYNITRYLKGAHDKGLFISNDAGELVSRSSSRSLTNLMSMKQPPRS